MFLYGGRNEAALVELGLALRTRFPGLVLVGAQSAPFRELSREEDERTAARINASGAQVVWVGTGQPRQEQWMARMRPALSAPMLIAVGAAFDFHAGLVPQAPAWMGRNGLEWTYRLAREPRRLWRRYARYNPRFVVAFAREYAAARRRRD
jgi:N-acetylglucosaminyldiphosphoundecaprenol N-acetyl-beta-D-mannosaminyltransferase